MLVRNFVKSIIDLHAVINDWSTSCRVRYMVCNKTVEIMKNLDTGGIIIIIKIGGLRGEDHKLAGFFYPLPNSWSQWFYQ